MADLSLAEETREKNVSIAAEVAAKALQTISVGDPGLQNTSFAIKNLFSQYAPLAYHLPWEILDYVELLSTFNPDYSQAVDNIRSLANSGFTLFVDGQTPQQEQLLRLRIEVASRRIQTQHGGIPGLIDKLLDQAATYGAMCGEWVVDEEMDDVIEFVDVNPKTIRFFWEDTPGPDLPPGRWMPYQRVNAAQLEEAKRNGQKVLNGCVKLNPITFHYYAFDAAPGSPYGTPPFLAALVNIAIQRDMITNMAQIVKKIGLLGIIDVAVEALQPKPGEDDAAYVSRAGKFLLEYAVAIQGMVRDGGLIHFNDVAIQSYQITGNASGATNIFKQNEELIFSGLKSMPSVQGRSYCVVPETRVLTADLRWVQAGELHLDDELVGFDEDLGKGRGSGAVAHMKRSMVERNKRIKLPCVKVTTDKGEITVSNQHPLVVLGSRLEGRVWRDAADLRPGDRLIWFGEPWKTETSYDAGYLSGMFDGEGSVGRSGSGKNGSVTMAQLPGVVLDETIMALKRLGFESTCGLPNEKSGVCHLRILGGKAETLRFLGSVRPHRLLEKAYQCWEGASIRNGGSINQSGRIDAYATVQRVRSVGVREVIALQTSSRTFISEGLLSHNSTTETYAGVAYDIIIRNTGKYQRAVASMIGAGYWLMASLWGMNPQNIRIEFKSNKTLHRLQDAQAANLEVINAWVLWLLGIIDQMGAAQLLGYTHPAIPKALPPPITPPKIRASADLASTDAQSGKMEGSGNEPGNTGDEEEEASSEEDREA